MIFRCLGDPTSPLSLAPQSARGELRTQIPKYTNLYPAHQKLTDRGDIASFADSHLTDAMKQMASDSTTDKRVKKKLMHVLASWQSQFKGDSSMSLVAGLYRQCNRASKGLSFEELAPLAGLSVNEGKKKEAKEEARKKAQREKEEARERVKKEEQQRLSGRSARGTRTAFNFEKVLILFRGIKRCFF